MELINPTPFAAERLAVRDIDGTDLLLVLLKASFDISDPDAIRPAEDQEAIELADRYGGEPGESSLDYASDFSLGKPAAEIAVRGFAYPETPGDREAIAGIRVGRLSHRMRVYGERRWRGTVGGYRPGKPEPFTRIPLSFEHAFGGRDTSHPKPERHDFDARNPIGRGFRAAGSKRDPGEMPLPNFEDPDKPIGKPSDRGEPVVPGFIPPGWQPRAGFAGTYDQAWQDTRMPMLPEDFDPRFFIATRLVYDGFLQGGEEVAAIGLSPRGPLRFALPRVDLRCRIKRRDSDPEPLDLAWDRLVIDPEEMRLIALWTGRAPVPTDFSDIAEIGFEME